MLEDLDKINWAKLTHAYGAASDVPQQIRNLGSKDEVTRQNALSALYANIFHQGTRYQATPYAISFLYELLFAEGIEDKSSIVFLLINLALGYEDAYLPYGFNEKEFRQELLEYEESLSEAEKTENEQFGYNAQSLIACYENVKKGLPLLLKFVNEENQSLRRASIYALSWFSGQFNEIAPTLQKSLTNSTEETDKVNTILSLGFLAKGAKVDANSLGLNTYLESSSLIIRVSTAIVLAQNPLTDKIIEILIEGMSAEEMPRHEGFYFNEGDIIGLVSLILGYYGENAKDKIVPLLCQTLQKVSAIQSINVTQALFKIVNQNWKVLIQNTPFQDLSAIDKQVLYAIAYDGGWFTDEKKEVGFANYSLLIGDAGLFYSQEDLIKYVESS